MPLSPLSSTALNVKSTKSPSISPKPPMNSAYAPPPPSALETVEKTETKEDEISWDEEPSSPFMTEYAVASEQQKTAPLTEITESFALSPSSQLKMEAAPFQICEDETSTPVVGSVKRRMPSASPSRRVKPAPSVVDASELLDNTMNTSGEDANIDDTCYSAFSEIPNMDMTRFAQIKLSPSKQSVVQDSTFRTTYSRQSPTRSSHNPLLSSPSATPKATLTRQPVSSGNTTNLLLDFTEQFDALAGYTSRVANVTGSARKSPARSGNDSYLLSYLQTQRRSPSKSGAPSTPSRKTILNLLDFELPPAPTPRSVPSISIRELESLKSQYASEISSLKATLSGREAEVEALKRAVSDAETRVGEAMEASREERARREAVERERQDWERRGVEFQSVLTKVKAEVIELDRERAELASRLESSEEKGQELEARVAEAEERAAKAESRNLMAASTTTDGQSLDGESVGPMFTAEQVQRQIDDKVHALSAELHAIYKKKHVTKVSGLKKGFEAKTKEATATLQAKIEDLEKANEELQNKLDGTLSGVLPTASASLSGMGMSPEEAERRRQKEEQDRRKLEEQAAEIERQKAELVGRDSELKTQKSEFAKLMSELEKERVEKGELVAAVDEMLALQADMTALNASVSGTHPIVSGATPSAEATLGAVEDIMRKSVGLGARPSGLARPGFGFGGAAGGSRLAKPLAGLAGKSRMMANIERMGGRSAD